MTFTIETAYRPDARTALRSAAARTAARQSSDEPPLHETVLQLAFPPPSQ